MIIHKTKGICAMEQLTMGSLFDGSGGFPLAGVLSGVIPIWASEIEPFPIRVTTKRFPNIKHLGNVSEINGAEIEPVDIITGGSPCQDMSVAGKRKGMKNVCQNCETEFDIREVNTGFCPHCGEPIKKTRSGLFMEQIRIIKEMRASEEEKNRLRGARVRATDVRPRFMLWENVPGALSSNDKEDFLAVLEETARVKDPTVSIPKPAKWETAGQILGNDYSIAWRILDAQYAGVPQRRRRIFLVADFGGQSASEILFEQLSVQRDTEEGAEERQSTSADAERGFGETGFGYWGNGEQYSRAEDENRPSNVMTTNENSRATANKAFSFDSLASNSMKSKNPNSGCREVDISKTIDTTNPCPSKNQGGIAIVQALGVVSKGNGECFTMPEKHTSLSTGGGQAGQGYPCVLCMATQQGGSEIGENLCPTITAAAGMSGNNQPVACFDKNDLVSTGFNGYRRITANIEYHEELDPCMNAKMPSNVTSGAFIGLQGSKAGSIGYQNEQSPTVIAGQKLHCVTFSDVLPPGVAENNCADVDRHVVIENHPQAGRVSIDDSGTTQTLTSKMGTGGGNVPLVMAFTQNQREEVRNLQEKAGAIAAEAGSHQQTYLAIPIQGNLLTSAQNGNGIGIEGDPMYTMTARDKHAICFGVDQQGGKGQANFSENVMPALCADSHGTPHAVCLPEDGKQVNQTLSDSPSTAIAYDCRNHEIHTISGTLQTKDNGGQSSNYINPVLTKIQSQETKPIYTVRRLTPNECARLQGFDPSWTDGLETENPTDEEIAFWEKVFETHHKLVGGTEKPKSRKQIIKWLKKPYNDSPAYKMWGNGICLNCALPIMKDIAFVLRREYS